MEEDIGWRCNRPGGMCIGQVEQRGRGSCSVSGWRVGVRRAHQTALMGNGERKSRLLRCGNGLIVWVIGPVSDNRALGVEEGESR